MLWYLFRTPIYIYRWHLEWLFGKRLLLLTHTGRRSGVRRQTVLEVVEYRGDGPEVIVANGFGPDSDWLRNIQAKSDEEVTVGPQHFAASHRFLGEDEAMKVIKQYEHRNRLITPIVRAGFTWLLGWRYRATETDRQRLVRQIPPACLPTAIRIDRIKQTRFGLDSIRTLSALLVFVRDHCEDLKPSTAAPRTKLRLLEFIWIFGSSKEFPFIVRA